MIAIHNKTGNIYKVIGLAINCTNKNVNEIMVVYTNENITFVREFEEFSKKFNDGLINSMINAKQTMSNLKHYDTAELDKLATYILAIKESNIFNKEVIFHNEQDKILYNIITDTEIITRPQIIEYICKERNL